MKCFPRIVRDVLTCAIVLTVLTGVNALADLSDDQAYALGDKAEAGDKAALEILKSEAQKRNARASTLSRLGLLYYNGKGVPQDYDRAARWCLKAELQRQESRGSCSLLFEHDQAAQWVRKAAQQGNADAQYLLGWYYYMRDESQAAQWFDKSAQQGNVLAQYSLGQFYDEGVGVPQDYAQAAQWFSKAAEQGYAGAQSYLGDYYAKGQGVRQDYDQAAQWYRKAVQQGDAWGQDGLGMLYKNGQGVPQDYAQAAYWFRKAAEVPTAQINLGLLYANGQGAPRSKVVAYALFNLVAANRFANLSDSSVREKASDLRSALSKTMTEQEIEAGQALSRKMNRSSDFSYVYINWSIFDQYVANLPR